MLRNPFYLIPCLPVGVAFCPLRTPARSKAGFRRDEEKRMKRKTNSKHITHQTESAREQTEVVLCPRTTTSTAAVGRKLWFVLTHFHTKASRGHGGSFTVGEQCFGVTDYENYAISIWHDHRRTAAGFSNGNNDSVPFRTRQHRAQGGYFSLCVASLLHPHFHIWG